jgi:uncharacterized SAM-dependent methyltransferase
VLLLGVDRRKDERTLCAAYDDAAGVTAAFNQNILARINRELDANFELGRFRHRAPWDDAASRIEMHLESTVAQVAHVDGVPIRFAAGETIWTECSYKYDRARLERLAEESGFTISHLWSDVAERFWMGYLVA